MRVLAVGVSHRTADLRLLERAAVPAGEIGAVLRDLLRCDNLSEAIVISSRNRVEVYAEVESFQGGLADIIGVLPRHAEVDTAGLYEHLYVHHAAAAAQHLFTVTAGLDSQIVGEAQTIDQVHAAYLVAREAGTVGATLHELIQQALRVGNRVHTETGLARTGDPSSTEAETVLETLADAGQLLGGLPGRRALVVGAGSTGGLAAAALRRMGIGGVIIADHAEADPGRLAAGLRAQGVPARSAGLADLAEQIAEVDVVVCCSGTLGVVVDEATVIAATADREADRALVVCDLSVPCDVESRVATLAGVHVITVTGVDRGAATVPELDTRRAHAIVAEELRGYLAAQRSARATPAVSALRRRAAQVVHTELVRMDGRLPGLDSTVRDEVTRTVRRVVDRLLHNPIVRIKELASDPTHLGYTDVVRELFQLELHPAAGA